MYVSDRLQLPGYAAESRPLLFLSSIPVKRYEVGRIVATEMREYMKVIMNLTWVVAWIPDMLLYVGAT